MLARVHSAQVNGLRAHTIDVELDISRGLHSFSIVGLPDKAIEEAKDRIRAAIKNSGIELPQQSSKKIIVSLAPADLRKEGASFDLGIALAFLSAMETLTFDSQRKLFVGELSLGGEVRPIRGALLIAEHAEKQGFTELYVPEENAAEASLIKTVTIYPVKTLHELVAHLNQDPSLPSIKITPYTSEITPISTPAVLVDFADIQGQEGAKRGLEIAAAGGHNVAMFGPPGTGKTMLAKAFTGILPPLSFKDALEATSIHSIAGTLDGPMITHVPFRAPHHTASYISLVGGGSTPRPGEITLAHKGVLFLDEFPEFDRKVIEALRQPLEDRVIAISRARGSIRFPAHFILVATMNPCPCGNRGHKTKECICPPSRVIAYDRKLSGPIMDRIDLWLEVPEIRHAQLREASGEPSSTIQKRVEEARKTQEQRFVKETIKTNAEMGVRELKKYAPLKESTARALESAATKMSLSARAYHRVIKISRTIADLEGTEDIEDRHLFEALQYRPKRS